MPYTETTINTFKREKEENDKPPEQDLVILLIESCRILQGEINRLDKLLHEIQAEKGGGPLMRNPKPNHLGVDDIIKREA